jgi:S1-C subfamily serine protease
LLARLAPLCTATSSLTGAGSRASRRNASDYFPQQAQDVANYLDSQQDTEGLFVLGTDPGSPAAKANFAEGDYINAIDQRPVTSVADVCEIAKSNPGGTVTVGGRYLASATVDNGEQTGNPFTQDMRLP